MVVKIVELGKQVVEVAVAAEVATVEQVCELGNVDVGNVKINGRNIVSTSNVYDGDVIFIGANKIKGNSDFVEVKFIQFGAAGGGVNTVAVAPGTSVSAAASTAGVSIESFELRDGTGGTLTAETPLYANTKVLLTKKVKGNSDFVEVKFIQFGAAGGGVNTVAVSPGTQVSSAASTAGVSIESFELRDGTGGTLTAESALYVNTKVLLTKKVKGNK